MKPAGNRNTLELALCLVCVCAMALLDGARAQGELLWGDEIISVQAAESSFPYLVVERYYRGHSPLYFAVLKLWLSVSSIFHDLDHPSALLVRMPSIVFMGLAGGLLSATAWRAWGAAAGVLLLALWVGNNLVERYAVEARPYAMLIFFLASAVWSSTRLWLEEESGNSALFEKIAVYSRVLAAATIPLGALAVLAMEACSYRVRGSEAYNQYRQRRARSTVRLVIIVFAVFLPAIAIRSINYWVEQQAPLSWETFVRVATDVYFNAQHVAQSDPYVFAAAAAVPAIGVYGLIATRHGLPARLAAGLAIALPAVLVFMSIFNSLMISRYFVAAIPGVLLLAACASSRHAGYGRRPAAVALACAAGIMLFNGTSPTQRHSTFPGHLALLKSLNPGKLNGGTNSWGIWKFLPFYLPQQTGQPADIVLLRDGLGIEHPADSDELYWFFGNHRRDDTQQMVAGFPVLCRYRVEKHDIYVIGRSRDALPAAMRDCPQRDK